MNIIDAQVHAYESDSPHRPWKDALPGPASVTGDELVQAMLGARVDKALLVSPWTMYGTDASYVLEASSQYPDHFGLVAAVDPYGQGAAAAIVSWAGTRGAVGIRFMAGATQGFRPDHPDVRAAVLAAAEAGLPVCVLCLQQLWIIEELARLYPDAQFVLDHLGLMQPLRPPAPADPFAELDRVIGLAAYPNLAVKVTGMCTLSHQPFPFEDLRQPLDRLRGLRGRALHVGNRLDTRRGAGQLWGERRRIS